MHFNIVTLKKPPGVKTYCFKIPSWAKPVKRHFNTHQTEKKEAERVRDEFLTQRFSQANSQTYKEAYLDKAIETYLMAKRYLAKKSFIAYRGTLLEFKNFMVSRLGKMPRIQEIDKPLCEGYLQGLLDRRLNPHTRNDRRNILTNFFIYAVDENWLMKNPVEKISKIEEPDSVHPSPLNEEEVRKILNELKRMKNDTAHKIKCYYEIMAIVYYAGVRISEATHLLRSDIEFSLYRINLQNKTICKETYNTKTKKHWYTPIVSELERILKMWIKKTKSDNSLLLFPNSNGNPIKIGQIYDTMIKVLAKLGFPPDKISSPLHRGRHTFASITRQKGVEEPLVQAALGHSSNIMTRHYTHLPADHVRNKFNKLSYGQSKKGRI